MKMTEELIKRIAEEHEVSVEYVINNIREFIQEM